MKNVDSTQDHSKEENLDNLITTNPNTLDEIKVTPAKSVCKGISIFCVLQRLCDL